MENQKSRKLLWAAFLSGMGTLMIEVASFRLVAPFFGTSIFVYTNILGIIMAALAVGYFFGGKLADKFPKENTLGIIFVITGVVDALLPIIALPLFSKISINITAESNSLLLVSFIGSLIVFFIPFVLMGSISPYLIRLANKSVEDSGKTAGRIFAVSTIGSILGTFLPPLLLIPTIGTRRTIILMAILLVVTAFLFTRKWFVWMFALILIAAFWFLPTNLIPKSEILLEELESQYSVLRVIKRTDNILALQQDDPIGYHSVLNPNSELTGLFYDQLLAIPYFQDKTNQKVAIIGNAAGTLARQYNLLLNDREFEIDGIEIDPAATQLGKKYFDMQDDHANIITMDGRIFLETTDNQYDIILMDAYHHLSIPPHLTSNEFFSLMANHLTKDGVAILNVNSLDTEQILFKRILATFQNNFKNTWVINGGGYNYEIIGTNGSQTMENAVKRFDDPRFSKIQYELAFQTHPYKTITGVDISTDDRPLVEIFYDSMFIRKIFGLS